MQGPQRRLCPVWRDWGDQGTFPTRQSSGSTTHFQMKQKATRGHTRPRGCVSVCEEASSPAPPRPARQGELRASPSLSPLSVKPQPPARLLRSGLRLPSKCSYRTPLPTSPPPPETHALGPPPPAAPAAGLGPPRRFPGRCSGPSPSGVRSPWGPQTCLFPSRLRQRGAG